MTPLFNLIGSEKMTLSIQSSFMVISEVDALIRLLWKVQSVMYNFVTEAHKLLLKSPYFRGLRAFFVWKTVLDHLLKCKYARKVV